MWFRMHEGFREEARQTRLAFTCEECEHFSPEDGRCAIFFPTEPHRRATVEQLEDGERVYFCKMFEAR